MTRYIIRRILLVPLLLFGTTILIFSFTQLLDPVQRSSLWLREVPRNPAAWDAAIKKYCLDCPAVVQYWNWVWGVEDPSTGQIRGGLLRGNLGYSVSGRQYVTELLAQRFPATLELTLFAFPAIVLGGVWLGMISALNHNRWIDQVLRVFSIVGWSFPTFVFGLLVLMLFYAQRQWFPPGRISDWANVAVLSSGFQQYTHLMTIDSLLNLRFDIFIDAIRHLVLPVVTLSYLSWALLLRVTRSSMLETLRQDYVTTARAKGLTEGTVVNKHARPNAMIPVATVSGFTAVGLLNGVVITETVFDFPGIGSSAARAALQLDVVTVLGLALFTGFLLVMANLVVDIMYVFLDPRVRLE